MKVGDIIKNNVEKLVTKGKGLIRHQGCVIFVEYVIPGEEVEVELVLKKKNYFIAKLKKVIKESEYRVSPHCVHFGFCGGCKLQHIQYNEQVFLFDYYSMLII